MAKNYPHMLAPIRVRNHLLKNRLLSSCCMPSFLCGPEQYIPEGAMKFFENLARAGAAYITVRDHLVDTRGTPMNHSPWWPIEQPLVQNYHSQLAERIHFQGSVVSAMIMVNPPKGYDVCEGEMAPPMEFGPDPNASAAEPPAMPGGPGGPGMPPPGGNPGSMPPPMPGGMPPMEKPEVKLGPHGYPMNKELTHEQIHAMIDEWVEKAKLFQSVGFDGVTIHMAYRGPVVSKFLSRLTNHRTDEYGGCLENRARFAIELLTALREGCGEDFIIELEISGEEPEGGNTLEETIEFVKMVDGLVDIVQLRHSEIDPSHPTGYTWDGKLPHTLQYAEAFKKAGVKAIVSPSGGFGDYQVIEDAIASGKCDTVDMARSFIVDPDFALKAAEGRPEDRIPCIGCNKCHNPPKNKWITVCSVNPMLGLAHHQEAMVKPAVRSKNVAIIGGGPAGMRAAIFCRERGHVVTLYEKGDKLGGQLLHADYPAFKWPLKDFKDYLARQMEKDDGITVVMNTDATPELIASKNYDAVIVAIGSKPVFPPVPGAETCGAWTPIGVYGHEPELGKRIVVVGGGDSATETGLWLAEEGHEVTILCRQKALAIDNQGVHFYTTMRARWEANPNFTPILNATTTKVEPGRVTYTDRNGEHVLECDDIILSGGVRKDDDLVASYFGCAPEVVTCGDCKQPGALTEVNFTAYAAACRL